MDRQDIDALLIGALYSELTPAEEARLAAHLESHPADRGALDDLKSARAAVRESRIFDAQAEPPQAISALLLQEAHRRAPKHVASSASEPKESWFYRFTRVFMAHPAVAAAAMLVLVVGVAGTLYVNKGKAGFVEREASSPALSSAHDADKLAAPHPTVAPSEGAAGQGLAEEADPGIAASGSAMAAPSADTGGGEPAPADRTLSRDEGRAGRKDAVTGGASGANRDGYNAQLLDSTERGRYDAAAEKQQRAPAPAPTKKKSAGLVVTTPEREPKELEAPRQKVSKASKAPVVAKGDYDAAESGAYDDAPASASDVRVGGAAPAGTASSSTRSAGKGAAPAPVAQAPAPPPPTATATAKPSAPKAEAAPASPAPATNASLIAWAKAEHSVTVALANKGDCVGAAKRAVQVENRAPDYYAQFMATDRALKKCQAYIAQQRDAEQERVNKTRSQKRATDSK